jgi:hypothetical protein
MQDAKIVTPALRTVGNIVTGDDLQTQAVLNVPNIMVFLHSLLHHTKKSIRKETMWTLSNVAAGNVAQIQTIIDEPGLVHQLVHCLLSDCKEVRKEASWVISNMTAGGTQAQFRVLASTGAIVALTTALGFDRKVDCVVIEGIQNCLKGSESKSADGLFAPHDVRDVTVRPVSFADVHGFQRVFRDDDDELLLNNLRLQFETFDVISKVKAAAARGVDNAAAVLASLGYEEEGEEGDEEGEEAGEEGDSEEEEEGEDRDKSDKEGDDKDTRWRWIGTKRIYIWSSKTLIISLISSGMN